MQEELPKSTPSEHPGNSPEMLRQEMAVRFPAIDIAGLAPEDIEFYGRLEAGSVSRKDFEAWGAKATMDTLGQQDHPRQKFVTALSRLVSPHEKGRDDILTIQ